MNAERIKQAINAHLSAEYVVVDTPDDVHFSVIVVSAAFEGLSLLKRHQAVYAAVTDGIRSGQLHALSLKTYTPKEWQNQQTK